MKRRVLLLAATLFFSAPAAAIIQLCTLSGPVGFSPAHPGPDDPVAFRVSLHFAHLGGAIVSRATVQANTIDIDVIVNSSEPSAFPDHRDVSRTYWLDDVFGRLGPLSIGSYAVRVVVRDHASGGTPVLACGYETVLAVEAEPGVTRTLPVVEYYHAGLDHYFVTQDVREIADLDVGRHPGWARTGQTFGAYASDASDARGSAACRWYGVVDGAIGTHFLSASRVECSGAGRDAPPGWNWVRETDNAFEIALPDLPTGACAAGTIPVYRLWNNRRDSNHRYTTDATVKQQMIARGWIPEGFGPDSVAMCAPSR